ncbi:hypothetical protein TWF696_001204 [Orbilia brochopaga]|uniref:5-formyltetrahydrofolate cyclo-ligase n=1 Tax=Orbilia brochopaga TaxID=3140254 RepID=A0AAV9UBL1_9PEZI
MESVLRRMSTNEALREAKRELRALIARKLDTVDPRSVQEQSRIVFKLLSQLPQYQQARRISVYLSMPTGEIDTVPIVEDAFKQGKQVFIPFTHKAVPATSSDEEPKPSIMDMVSLHSLEDYQGLKRNSWGIPTPTKRSLDTRKNCIEEVKAGEHGLDLIVVPGVAFDGACRRLGHGKGYYDYFFKRYHEAAGGKLPFTVGVALQEQMIDTPTGVPVGDKDWPMDMILVGNDTSISRE